MRHRNEILVDWFPRLRSATLTDARDQLSRLVHAAESGEEISLTRRGRPVGVLLSERRFARLTGGHEGFWQASEAFRRDARDRVGIESEVLKGLRINDRGRTVDL